jgi:hypothetical protein
MTGGNIKARADSKSTLNSAARGVVVLRLSKVIVLLGLLLGLAVSILAGPESGIPAPATAGKFQLSSRTGSLPEKPDTGAVPTETNRFEYTGTNGARASVEITIGEGRNRQVRRMFQAVGHPVQRLRRLGYGGIGLGRLPVGQLRALSEAEVRELAVAAGRVVERPARRRPRSS